MENTIHTSVHVQMEGMLRDWHKTNPLRKWQMNCGMSQDIITQILDIGPRTWQCWVTGLYSPNEEMWEKLVKLIGDEEMPKKWDDWYATKPNVLALAN